MSVLLLRLAGPMQSWGTQSRFGHRDTGSEPSRSGVVGLLCAALGWQREQVTFEAVGSNYKLEEFSKALRTMAVRVDREGRIMRDYHTIENCRKADGTMPPRNKRFVESERFYLADADFLVGLEGDRAFLDRLDAALREPVWPLCLGRKAFVPSLPVAVGVRNEGLMDLLKAEPWVRRWPREKPPDPLRLRYVVEVPFGKGEPRYDVPLSFVSSDRKFALRHVTVEYHDLPPDLVREPEPEVANVPQ